MSATELVLDPDALFACAVALYRAGKPEPADAALSQMLERVPSHFDGWHLRGVLASQMGRPDRAVDSLQRAIRLHGRVPAAHRHLGNALRALGRWEEAVDSYTTAIECRADFKEAHVNRAMTLLMLARPAPALADLDRALDLGADDAEVHGNRAIALYLLGRGDESIDSCEQAIRLDPTYASAYAVRALCALDRQQPVAALESCDRALALRGDLADAHNTRGLALADLRRFEEALASFDRAIALDPKVREPYFNKGIRCLLLGAFDAGWELYERRPQRESPAALAEVELFDGSQELAGKTVWVHSEQGLGDTVQFCRYAKRLEAEGARVILSVPNSLRSLVQTLGETIEVVGPEPRPKFKTADLQCPLLSLPRAFRTRVESIPADVPYLKADPTRVAFWRERLNFNDRLIGIRWQGSTTRADVGRSFPLRLFEGIASLPGVRLVSLQRHAGEEQLRDLPPSWRVEELGPDFEPEGADDAFLDVAAVMHCVDLVISSDTSVAHLAGALGRPTWVALKYVPDWRWMLDRADSPWYPTMRLFRQTRPGDWPDVFARMRAALAAESRDLRRGPI